MPLNATTMSAVVPDGTLPEQIANRLPDDVKLLCSVAATPPIVTLLRTRVFPMPMTPTMTSRSPAAPPDRRTGKRICLAVNRIGHSADIAEVNRPCPGNFHHISRDGHALAP